ncbi:MAG: hypothetical protein V2A77_09665 [Pseudomonadota bacterium]
MLERGRPVWPLSVPPSGKYEVVNLYVDEDGKLVYEYDPEKPMP